MNHPNLLRLLEAHERAERELQVSSLAVWAALVDAEPELAADILRLFSTVEAASRWAASSFRALGGSPARLAAEGRAAEIVSRLHKTDHGFVG